MEPTDASYWMGHPTKMEQGVCWNGSQMKEEEEGHAQKRDGGERCRGILPNNVSAKFEKSSKRQGTMETYCPRATHHSL